jgi:ABC-type transport system involved in multi-copper enzyme maturation permease subunit
VPIYEQTYRRWEARGPLRSVRFWPITREALALVLAKRAFIGLLVLVWIPFVVRVIQVYVVTRFPEAGRVLPVDGRLFGDFLNQQTGLTLLLSIFGGAGLIANDLRTGAILVYLSRPLTRRDYVLGKLAVLMALNYSATLLPALLLYAVSLGLAPELLLKWELAWIGPTIVLHATILSLVVSLVALAISALSRSARVAGLAFAGLLVGLEIVRGVLEGILDRPEARVLSLQNDLRLVGNLLFGVAEPGSAVPVAYPIAILVLAVTACLAILRARVRAVEIVR